MIAKVRDWLIDAWDYNPELVVIALILSFIGVIVAGVVVASITGSGPCDSGYEPVYELRAIIDNVPYYDLEGCRQLAP